MSIEAAIVWEFLQTTTPARGTLTLPMYSAGPWKPLSRALTKLVFGPLVGFDVSLGG